MEERQDFINRQAAIDAVLSVIPYDEYWKERIEEAVGNLPSAQPERKTNENNHYKTGYNQGFVDACKMYEKKQPEIKTGWWICGDTGLVVTEYKCSECGRTVRGDTGYDVYLDYPYCHCGAKMEKKNEVYANEWLGL